MTYSTLHGKDPKQLMYRRQFLLSSVLQDRFPSWNRLRTLTNLILYSHPDLEVTRVKCKKSELILLGHMLDPFYPSRDNTEILHELLRGSESVKKLVDRTSRLSGRWAMIASGPWGAVLFNDPAGLRSVYYTNSCRQPFLAASQPGLIAGLATYKYGGFAAAAFLESDYRRRAKEYWWPGGVSMYEEIDHLLPNHFLDLDTKERIRFWPVLPIQPLALEESARQSAMLLKGIFASAAARFPLALPLTAGLDSRTLLAATRDIRKSVFYYTLLYWGLDDNSPDVRVPRRLLSRLGIAHHRIDCSGPMDNDFRDLYHQNVELAHDAWGDIAFGLSRKYPRERVCVKGNASEIARCFYYPYDNPKRIDGKKLAALAGMGGNQFAEFHFAKWLEQAGPAAESAKMEVLDLFYWEHRMGSWQAMSQLEWDLVQEATTPFNCRQLLSRLLSVDRKYRKPPHYVLYRRIIQELWPEVLKEPINPELFKTWRTLAKRVYRKAGFRSAIGA